MHLRSVTTKLNKSGSHKLRAKWLSQIEIQCKQDSTCEFLKHVLEQKNSSVSRTCQYEGYEYATFALFCLPLQVC